MASDTRSPGERIAAFGGALEEEVLRPARRYLRGFRVGLIVGVAAGVLLAPRPGEQTRARLLRLWRAASRRPAPTQPG